MTAQRVYVLGGYQIDFAKNWFGGSCTTVVSLVVTRA